MSNRTKSQMWVPVLFLVAMSTAFGQTRPNSNSSAGDPQSDETIKVETNLVTVPVIVSDRNDIYVQDMRKEEFGIKDDGAPQKVEFFATTTAPFHVVLMIDTSASTQQKLTQIQRAVSNFTDQLQNDDKVKVISFDDNIVDYGDFTSDRAELAREIGSTRAGKGTKLYDAVTRATDALRMVKGRKAIVIFTDGVDFHSDSSSFEDNRHSIQESGIIVYTIRFDTRAETERLARAQAQQSNGAPVDLATVLGVPSRGTTPSTFPGGGQVPKGDNPNVSKFPTLKLPDQRPPQGSPDVNNPFPDSNPNPTGRRSRFPQSSTRDVSDPSIPIDTRQYDNITTMLDNLYRTADDYLDSMATESGGQMVRADTLTDLPTAFATIANELRIQYSLGYYPSNHAKDGKYHKIQVSSTRHDVVVRSKPGYLATSGSGNVPARTPHGLPKTSP